MPTTARSLFLDVRGLRLHARVRGPLSAPAVLLLHGWLDQCGSFDWLTEALFAQAAQARTPLCTIALDFRGHGDSAWVGAGGFYHFVEYVPDVDGVLDALAGLGLSAGPVRLIGHSLGGAVALLFAAARPARVSHVTMLDSLPLTVPSSEVPGRLAAYLDDLTKARARRTVSSLEQAAQRMRKANSSLPETLALHLAAGGISPDPAQDGKLAWKWDPWLRAHSPLPLTEEPLQEVLAQVRAPLFLLRAGETWLPGEAEIREHLRRVQGPITIETLAGTGHHLHLEAPAEVAARVARAWAAALH